MKSVKEQVQPAVQRQNDPFFKSPGQGLFDKKPGNFLQRKEQKPFFSKPVQAKMAVNASGDNYEREADAMADKVMRMPAAGAEEKDKLQRNPAENISRYATNAASQSSHTVSGNVSTQINASRGGGMPMQEDTQQVMETGFGTDFSDVRIHTDANAVQLSRELNAHAFTTGSDIYFNEGKYAPHTGEGKHLLAHELTHTVQQGVTKSSVPPIQRKAGDGHDLKSPRFAGDPVLEDVFDIGGPEIKKGDTGMHVRLVQQALIDAGEVLPGGVNGIFQDETITAVKSYQTKHRISKSGTINGQTLQSLDNYFINHGSMAGIPRSMVPSTAPTPAVEWPVGKAPAELTKGTRTLEPSEKTEIEKRRSTEITAPPGGKLPDFKNKIPGSPQTYEERIEIAATEKVAEEYNELGKGKAALHKDATQLHKWNDIEKVAAVSKKVTDKVFGNFAKGNAFKQGKNLVDGWDDKESQFAKGGKAYEDASVEWRVKKIIQAPDVSGVIDREHGAIQSRTVLSPGESRTEVQIIAGIRNRIIAGHRAELIETHKGWPGYAKPETHQVFIQRFKGNTPFENRYFMWDQFQTLVHEYIHTLAHSKYSQYADKLDDQKGGKTYREGMTEYFTKIVLESTPITDTLRAEIEGSFYDPVNKFPNMPYIGYDEATNAEAVAGVVGLRNVMAAFFLGKIELIGG